MPKTFVFVPSNLNNLMSLHVIKCGSGNINVPHSDEGGVLSCRSDVIRRAIAEIFSAFSLKKVHYQTAYYEKSALYNPI